MKLPEGVSGFHNSKTNSPPPKVDGRLFKYLCFKFALHSGGKVIDFHEPRFPVNFYCIQIELGGNRFFILLNEHYPYLAFASEVDFNNIKFIDQPGIYEHFAPFYQIFSTDKLNVPFDQSMVETLYDAELEQISYWKPERVGEIIFTYWD